MGTNKLLTLVAHGKWRWLLAGLSQHKQAHTSSMQYGNGGKVGLEEGVDAIDALHAGKMPVPLKEKADK